MTRRLLILCQLSFCAFLCSAQIMSVDGDWNGIWTNPAGFVYSAHIILTSGPGCRTCAVIGDGSVQGKILWTLRKSPASNSTDLSGITQVTATEYVRGEMKGEGFLVLNGYQKDDPHNIIGLDQYRLAISDNGKVIGGITANNGSWTGQLIAMRAQPKPL